MMKLEDLAEREMTHSGETTVQLLVLVQDATGDGLEILRRLGEQITHGSRREVMHRHVQPPRDFGKPALGVAREVQGERHAPKVSRSARRCHARQSNDPRLSCGAPRAAGARKVETSTE